MPATGKAVKVVVFVIQGEGGVAVAVLATEAPADVQPPAPAHLCVLRCQITDAHTSLDLIDE
jgi:hypothetical protein